MVVTLDHVGTRAHRDEVGRERLGARQRPDSAFAGLGAVADDHPVLGRGDGHGIRGLEVGLVEASEDRRRGVEEEMPVDIRPLVGRIDTAMKPLAVARVGHGRLHHEDVVGREVGQREASVVELAGIEITAVEADRRQRDRVELDEGRRSRFATTESNRRDRSEMLSTGRQVEGNLHRGDLEETGPGDRLVTSQGRHGADPRTRARQ